MAEQLQRSEREWRKLMADLFDYIELLEKKLTDATGIPIEDSPVDVLRRQYDRTLGINEMKIAMLRNSLARAFEDGTALRKENNELRKKTGGQERHPLRTRPVQLNTPNVLTMLKAPATPIHPRDNIVVHVDSDSASDGEHHHIHSDQHSESSDLTPTQFTLGETVQDQSSQESTQDFKHLPARSSRTDCPPTVRRGSIDLSNDSTVPTRVKIEDSDSYHRISKAESQDMQYTISSPAKMKEEHETHLPNKEEIKDSLDDSQDHFNFSLPTPRTNSKLETPVNPRHRDLIKRNIQQMNTPTESRPTKRLYLQTAELELINLSQNPVKNRDWIIEDFKINPEMNDDLTFAYQVVIRGAKRRCIHGKTCQDCDKFYKSMGDLTTKQGGPRWNSGDDGGDDNAFDVVKVTSRHRDLWDKPESPPGFGQFDFPSTQQRLGQKSMAQKMKKRMAYERLYSAIHDKRWLFKDASLNEAVNSQRFTVDMMVFRNNLKQEDIL